MSNTVLVQEDFTSSRYDARLQWAFPPSVPANIQTGSLHVQTDGKTGQAAFIIICIVAAAAVSWFRAMARGCQAVDLHCYRMLVGMPVADQTVSMHAHMLSSHCSKPQGG